VLHAAHAEPVHSALTSAEHHHFSCNFNSIFVALNVDVLIGAVHRGGLTRLHQDPLKSVRVSVVAASSDDTITASGVSPGNSRKLTLASTRCGTTFSFTPALNMVRAVVVLTNEFVIGSSLILSATKPLVSHRLSKVPTLFLHTFGQFAGTFLTADFLIVPNCKDQRSRRHKPLG
jgi:hypothetical protein